VSRYQKGKPMWILLKQKSVSGSGISWALCKSAPRLRQITMPAPCHSVFYRPDSGYPYCCQPTASKQYTCNSNIVSVHMHNTCFIVPTIFLTTISKCFITTLFFFLGQIAKTLVIAISDVNESRSRERNFSTCKNRQ